jgi:hypothetical protein
MSFVGRAAVWANVSTVGDAANGAGGNRSSRLPAAGRPRSSEVVAAAGTRLTPLNVMTGARIAASGVAWADGQTWDEDTGGWLAPRLTAQLRRPYQHLFEALRGRANRAPEARTCPRCGQQAHNDWGQAYERLVCLERTLT